VAGDSEQPEWSKVVTGLPSTRRKPMKQAVMVFWVYQGWIHSIHQRKIPPDEFGK
jgi:hypothetical protein